MDVKRLAETVVYLSSSPSKTQPPVAIATRIAIALRCVELNLEGAEKLMRLINALEDDDDVQTVTANFEISDEVMAQL